VRRLWALVPARIRRFFEARFTDVSTSEENGYAVWCAMGLVVGVPEIWAAIEGDDFYWPTISTTIGHLQERWPVVAPAGARAHAGGPSCEAGRPVRRTPRRRRPATGDERGEWPVVPYFAFAPRSPSPAA
jgi:hypothetical protein